VTHQDARHAAASGVALQLSGHAHGGMIVGLSIGWHSASCTAVFSGAADSPQNLLQAANPESRAVQYRMILSKNFRQHYTIYST
jgi:hypothetical protein